MNGFKKGDIVLRANDKKIVLGEIEGDELGVEEALRGDGFEDLEVLRLNESF